jgi:hypothetical protein
MEKRIVANADAAIAELTSLALAGDVTSALDVVDQLIKLGSKSTFVWAQFQARLLHAAMDDPRMPGALLAALIDRFHWAEPISALNRFHPDLRARVSARLAEAQAWLDDLHASARRLDDVGSAARLVLRPPSTAADLSRLTPGTRRALQGFVDAAVRYGPLLGAAINQEGVERLERSSRAEAPPIDALAHIGAASRLPEGARWALALSAMYTISQYGSDATLQPFLDAQPEQSLAILRDYWGITAESPEVRREQTIDRLTWLLNEGHRADPQCAEPGDPEAPIDLLAWDLARAAMTTRHAYLADCLTESESWSYLLTIALKAQTSFESWRDYADRYRRGRIRWSNALYDRFDNILTFLIEDPHSPWRRLPWRLRLDETTVRGPSFDVAPRLGERLIDVWRRHKRLVPQVAAVLVVALLVVGWEAYQRMTPTLSVPAAQPSAVVVSPLAEPTDDPNSSRGEFSRIQVLFAANGAGVRANFRNPPTLHPLSDFRYGFDRAIPDRALGPKQIEATNKGLPQALDAPAGLHFLTIQARLDDGAQSPTLRFDVPADPAHPRP